MIKEDNDQAKELLAGFVIVLTVIQDFFSITYKTPVEDVVKRLFNEVVKFDIKRMDKETEEVLVKALFLPTNDEFEPKITQE